MKISIVTPTYNESENIEKLYREIKKEFVPLQVGDVPNTYSDTTKLKDNYNYDPIITVKEGVIRFLDWYVEYYKD